MAENKTFKALIVEEQQDNTFKRGIRNRTLSDLPDNDVLIRVHYSSLNYKDALSASGNKGVTKKYPHTPGIDAAGVIEASKAFDLKPGDEVIVTSYDLGMNTSGGFGQYINVPADWIIHLPEGLSLKESMMFGTAGFTAGMSVHQIVSKKNPGQGEILVTGASGGVGSFSVAILAKLGYSVVAVTGKKSSHDFLTSLGASRIISREEALDKKERPMLKPQWAGVIDTVGGDFLANSIKATAPYGIIAACGNVASPFFSINVFPFILRGVSLIGIDSQNYPMHHRANIWKNLACDWKPDMLHNIAEEIKLDEINPKIDDILEGEIQGRVLVDLLD